MAYRLAALRPKDTTETPRTGRARVGVVVSHEEGSRMTRNRLRHLAAIRFELVQAIRARLAAGAYDSDTALDACLDELLSDLA